MQDHIWRRSRIVVKYSRIRASGQGQGKSGGRRVPWDVAPAFFGGLTLGFFLTRKPLRPAPASDAWKVRDGWLAVFNRRPLSIYNERRSQNDVGVTASTDETAEAPSVAQTQDHRSRTRCQRSIHRV